MRNKAIQNLQDNDGLKVIKTKGNNPNKNWKAHKKFVEPHKCKFCGAWTSQPDYLCYKAPNNSQQ